MQPPVKRWICVRHLRCILCSEPFYIIISHHHRASCDPDSWANWVIPWICCYLWLVTIWVHEFSNKILQEDDTGKFCVYLCADHVDKWGSKGRRAILRFMQKLQLSTLLLLPTVPPRQPLLLRCCSMNYPTGGVYRQHKMTSIVMMFLFHFITNGLVSYNRGWHCSSIADVEGD